MKKQLKTALLTCLALVLVLSAAVGPSLAYFTTYVTAEGGYTIELEDVDVKFDEYGDGSAKHITIVSTGDDECYVRVRLYCGENIQLLLGTFEGEDWIYDPVTDYYYYMKKLGPVGSDYAKSTELTVKYEREEDLDTDYNIIVVAQCIPVLTQPDGTEYPNGPENPGWSLEPEVTYNGN